MNPDELDQLAGRVQKGDRDAFAELVFLIRHELRVFLSSYASSVVMIDDIVQNALTTCYENIAKYELRGTFLSWVKGIARNLMLKELQARSRYMTSDDAFLERIIAQSALETAQGAEREEARLQRLRGCLEKLPEQARELIQQRYYNRMRVQEIARRHDRTPTWTAVTLFRIREMLRECMEKEDSP